MNNLIFPYNFFKIVEVSGEGAFKSYEDKNKNTNYQNTLWVNNCRQFDKEVAPWQKFNNVIMLKGVLEGKPFSSKLPNENQTLKATANIDNVIKYKAGDDWTQKSYKVNLESLGKAAELLTGTNMIQGATIDVVGIVENSSYEKEDGNKIYTAKVKVTDASLSLDKEKKKDKAVGM